MPLRDDRDFGMESEVTQVRRRDFVWIVVTLSFLYVLGLNRAVALYGTLPLWVVIVGAILELLSGLVWWYVWIPYKVRRRRRGW